MYPENYDKATYLRHQQLILNHHGCCKFDENFAKSEIQSLVQIQHRPKIILLDLIEAKSYQSTKPLKIKANLDDLKALQQLYLEFHLVIKKLNLSNASVRHYAYLVIKSQVPQFLQRSSQVRYLYLIAFIAYQTFKLTDILTDTLLNSSVQNVLNLTARNQQERYFKERTQRSEAFDKLSHSVRQ